jgi:hypothetical protein
MNRPRLNVTPSIKAKTVANAVDAAVAMSMTRKENVQRPTSNAQRRSQKSSGLGVIGHSEIDSAQESRNTVGEIDTKKIDIHRSSGRYRRSQLNFFRAFLLSKTSLPKLSPARSRIRYLRSRGSFWKKRPGTMSN